MGGGAKNGLLVGLAGATEDARELCNRAAVGTLGEALT